MKRVAIVSAKRTAIGAFLGQFATISAPELAAFAIKDSIKSAALHPDQIQSAVIGNVLSAAVGQAPARQAVLAAGLPQSVTTCSVNKVCGSGMKAIMIASDMIRLGQYDVVLAGGMESMSQTPYLMTKARSGLRMGNASLIDGMVHDGLWDPYSNSHMGCLAELLVEKFKFTREQLDDFAINSLKKARTATANGSFADEIAAVEVTTKKGAQLIVEDEQPTKGRPEKVPLLRPVFKKDGTITAANASSINDGAAFVILVAEDKLSALNLEPLAWIESSLEFAHDPNYFAGAPVDAIAKLLDQQKLNVSDIDFWEINEAFAVVAMAVIAHHGLDASQVNVRGGACALGHPIGCSGARLVVTLLHILKSHQKKRGLASLCIGGGEATAMSIITA